MVITSLNNPKVQLARQLIEMKKVRDRERCFVAEGVRLIEEAVRNHIAPKFLIFSDNVSSRGQEILTTMAGTETPVFEVSSHIMNAISATENPQGILGVFSSVITPLPSTAALILVADGIRDPGNMGTLLRSAWAAGADLVISTTGSVDLFSPKVLRSGMGAHFALPVWRASWEEVVEQFPRGKPYQYMATVVEGGLPFWSCDFIQPSLVIIGGEAEGVSKDALSLATNQVTIPMASRTESLNAGIAGSLILFEAMRQRQGYPNAFKFT
jgi:TrmH family RNA methyltransferase